MSNQRKDKMSYSIKHDGLILAPPLQPVGRPDYEERIVNALSWRRNLLDSALAQFVTQTAPLTEAVAMLIETLRNGNKVFVAGNGGSAAEAQHFAAELVVASNANARPTRSFLLLPIHRYLPL